MEDAADADAVLEEAVDLADGFGHVVHVEHHLPAGGAGAHLAGVLPLARSRHSCCCGLVRFLLPR